MACESIWLGTTPGPLSSGQHVLIDPFLDDSPVVPVRSDRIDAQFILVSHGHFDQRGTSKRSPAGPGRRSSRPSRSASGSASGG